MRRDRWAVIRVDRLFQVSLSGFGRQVAVSVNPSDVFRVR